MPNVGNVTRWPSGIWTAHADAQLGTKPRCRLVAQWEFVMKKGISRATRPMMN